MLAERKALSSKPQFTIGTNRAMYYFGYQAPLLSIFTDITFLESAMENLRQLTRRAKVFGRRVEGRVLPPLLLWMLGVPGGICLVLWFFFFRGK
jgi:hypothetical protein